MATKTDDKPSEDKLTIARNKNLDLALQQIAKELSVDAVVEGSVTSAGGRIRIGARLIQAAGERTVWTSAFERALPDVLTLNLPGNAMVCATVGCAAIKSTAVARLATPNNRASNAIA